MIHDTVQNENYRQKAVLDSFFRSVGVKTKKKEKKLSPKNAKNTGVTSRRGGSPSRLTLEPGKSIIVGF